jgi:hypothetical protein
VQFLKARGVIAIFLLMQMPALAAASECSTIRLDKGNGPFANLPVYDQTFGFSKDSHICYAVTAALLRDAHRIQAGDRSGLLSSPLSIALQTRIVDSQRPPEKFRELNYDDSDPTTYLVGGGQIADALTASKGQHVCDQRWLDSQIAPVGLEKFLIGMAENKELNPELIKSVNRALSDKCADQGFVADLPVPHVEGDPRGDVTKAEYALIRDIIKSPGRKQKLVEEFQRIYNPERKIRHLGATVDRLLEQPKSSGVGVGFLYRALQAKNESGAHASVIVGRRKNPETKKCEYLVRDSYGPNCKDANGQDRYGLPCENGSVWVEARELMRDTISLTWIPPIETTFLPSKRMSESIR